MRLFLSGLRKLGRRQATWLTLGLFSGMLALIVIVVGAMATRPGIDAAERAAALSLVTFPVAYDAILSFMLGLGGLFAVIYGAAVAGSEWTWGTLKNAVARGESRSRYTLLSFTSVAVVIVIGLAVTFVVGVAAALVGAGVAGVPTGGLNDAATLGRLPGQLARAWLAVTMTAGLGFAIATLARSQLAGIAAGIGLSFGETFAGIFLPDIAQFLPFNVSRAAVETGTEMGGGFGGGAQLASLEPDTALVLVAFWLIGSLAVAALATERAEISGSAG